MTPQKAEKTKKFSNEEICAKLFKPCFHENERYIAQHISPVIKCKPNSQLKKGIVDYYKDFSIYDENDLTSLQEDFSSISSDILDNVIKKDYIKAFIESIIVVIQSDDSISSDTRIGMSDEYTRNNILDNWKTLDVRDFFANILYFTYLRPDNEKGADTLLAFTEDFIKDRIYSKNYISVKKNANGEKKMTLNKYGKVTSTELPPELTNSVVIRSSSQKILFREKEFEDIIDSIQNKHAPSVFIHGEGGRGKTSLARLVYCHLKDQYDCCGWINYSGDIRQSMISDLSINYSDETMIENDATKKWETIENVLKNNKQSKLLVIDNVDNVDSIEQHPLKDKELRKMSSWSNLTIIITSRLPELSGYDTSFEIDNLGNENDNHRCIELFYHYNPSSEKYRSTNEEVVGNLCALAGYNTMVIELLAKGSTYYSHRLDKYYQKLIANNFSCANDIPVETDHDFTVIKTDNSNANYYDIGNETVASQLFKLFNLKTRKPLQQLILWDFHCLRENEKVSIEEINEWMGYELIDLSPLIKEGWIKQLDDYFFIHPLVNQAISCSKETNDTYWKIKKTMIAEGMCSNELISSITANTFFSEFDSFELSLRKLIFADCLTYRGDYLSPNDWINIADFARRRGNVGLGIYYYKKAHTYYSSIPRNAKIDIKQYWKCTYFYGYMLSYTKAGYEDAEHLLNESLELAEKIIEENGETDDNMLVLATSLDHLGYILSNSLNNDIERITLADTYLTQAVQRRQILCDTHPEHYRLMHDYAWSLDNLGAFYTNIDVDNVSFRENPNPRDIPFLTKDEILENRKHAEWILKLALEIRILLANARGDTDSTEVAWTYFNLANLLYTSLVEKRNDIIINHLHEAKNSSILETAEEYIKKALEIYHRLDERFPGQHMSSEARTTALYGRLLKLFPNLQNKANEQLDRALKLYIILDNENPGRYEKEIKSLNSNKHSI